MCILVLTKLNLSQAMTDVQKHHRRYSMTKGPVTLLRIKETYELRMKIHKIIFLRTKFP